MVETKERVREQQCKSVLTLPEVTLWHLSTSDGVASRQRHECARVQQRGTHTSVGRMAPPGVLFYCVCIGGLQEVV